MTAGFGLKVGHGKDDLQIMTVIKNKCPLDSEKKSGKMRLYNWQDFEFELRYLTLKRRLTGKTTWMVWCRK